MALRKTQTPDNSKNMLDGVGEHDQVHSGALEFLVEFNQVLFAVILQEFEISLKLKRFVNKITISWYIFSSTSSPSGIDSLRKNSSLLWETILVKRSGSLAIICAQSFRYYKKAAYPVEDFFEIVLEQAQKYLLVDVVDEAVLEDAFALVDP